MCVQRLRLVLWNIQGYDELVHTDTIFENILLNNDVIVLTETWLTDYTYLRCPLETFILCGLSIFYFYFSPRWECFHRGENIPTAVRTFPPRWECSHRGGNVLTTVGILLTAVGMFPPRWECSHRGGNTSHCGGNVSTAVRTFPPR